MALNDLPDDSRCPALPLSSSSLSLNPAKFSTLAADALLDERFHHDLVGSGSCPSQTVSQVLTRGLFVRDPCLAWPQGRRLPCQCAAPVSSSWFSVLFSSWEPGFASSREHDVLSSRTYHDRIDNYISSSKTGRKCNCISNSFKKGCKDVIVSGY